MFPESHGFVAMPVTSCINDSFSNLSLSKILVMGDEIVRHCDRHSNDTVILRKHVTKYKNMKKYMVEFLRKFENRGIKISRGKSILITKSINLHFLILILYGVGCTL